MITRTKNKLEIELVSELWLRDVWHYLVRAANNIDKCHKLVWQHLELVQMGSAARKDFELISFR